MTTGRDDSHADAFGMHILGSEAEQRDGAVLELVASDAATRPKTMSAVISAPTGDDERFPMTAKRAKEHATRSVLDPKFDAIDSSVRGHRYVRFNKQVDRPAFITSDDEQQLMLPSEYPILDDLKFPAPHGSVSYAKMRGREDAERRSHHQHSLDAVYEARDNPRTARAPVLVNMATMLSRVVAEPLDDDNLLKDAVLCKLRANHDEIERAMRLLSTFKRPDVGFVDMRRATARSPQSGASVPLTERAQDAPRVNLNVLSTRPRSGHTLVNLARSSGRHVPAATSDHQALVLNDCDAVLSKRKRSVGLVDMKHQLPRGGPAFLDLTRDSATTRFLLQQQQLSQTRHSYMN